MTVAHPAPARGPGEHTAGVDEVPGTALPPGLPGTVERDGVRLSFRVAGAGRAPTVLLMPAWSIVSSRIWKAQVGYLSRHHRVVTFDGRGSGDSGRPAGPAAYTDEQYAADALAVLDATGTEQAVLVALSRGASWALHVAAEHPERVLGLIAIAPSCGFDVPRPGRDGHPFDRRLPSYPGWAQFNEYCWREGGHAAFLEFFFGEMFCEPHSTKQIEDGIGWGREVTPETLADTAAGALGLHGAVHTPMEEICRRVRCPVTVLHGTEDRVVPVASGERLAELTGGSLTLLEGSGHGAPARDPVRVNHAVRAFVDGLVPPAPTRTRWVRAASRRRPRVLYLSSPIGLGHARRDVAIAAELRRRRPDVVVDWLAQHPVSMVLADHGERLHPGSAHLAGESAHIEHEAGEHDLHAFQAIRSMDEVLVHNFMLFADVVADGGYDLVVGDEAWEVDYFLHENPELRRFRFAWLTDFVGWLPMPEGGAREAALTADLNAEMLEQRARTSWVRDRSIFVGDPEDVVTDAFGPGLPGIREWTSATFDFAGYVTGPDGGPPVDPGQVRRQLGVPPGGRLCLVTVGGSGVGGPLLHRVLDAVPLVRQQAPDLHFLVVAGPRIDPRSVPARPGVRVCGYVPDLTRVLAACAVAVVQGGLSTCMELTAQRIPFVYVPLRRHFEQNRHVRHRLARYRAGTCLDYSAASDPDALAAAVLAELGREVDYRPVATDGAARAAALLADLL